MADNIAVNSAISFYSSIPKNGGKPYKLQFSTDSAAVDIADDAQLFADQLVSQINQRGTDTDTKTVNIDEFTRLASGNKFKKLSEVTDDAQKSVLQETFNDISKGRALATSSDIAEFLRVRDTKDGKTDGNAVINFLI